MLYFCIEEKHFTFMKYTFEFMFIPKLIANGEFAFPDFHDFDDMELLEDAFEESGMIGDEPFPWDELTIVKHISRKCTYWFFRFPKPDKEPEAVYGMVVKRDFDDPCYYTLEMGEGDSYFLCKMDEDTHQIIQLMEGLCTEDEFKEKVLADVQSETLIEWKK